MSDWKNLCDFNPNPGDIYEEIGIASYSGVKKGEKSPVKIYSLILEYTSNISHKILFIDRHMSILRECRKSPRQYRKLTDIKEIIKYKPMPKFDWSYC